VRIPVVLAEAPLVSGREGVAAVRERQRAALVEAGRRAGAPALAELPRDADGAPVPFADGWRWTAANTRGAAVGAVARAPLGVDVESLTRPRVPAPGEFAGVDELIHAPIHAPIDRATDRAGDRAINRAGDDADRWTTERTLALWCAKEAVLKLTGVGIAELRACRLTGAPLWTGGEASLLIEHRGVTRAVRIATASGFVVALAADADAHAPGPAVELDLHVLARAEARR